MASRQTYEKCLAIGMKQRQLMGIIFLEMGGIFLISFAISVFIGLYLGKISLFAIKETISLLYYPINPNDIVLSTQTLIIAFLIGLFSYLANCIEPIIAIKTKKSFFRHGYDQVSKQSLSRLLWFVLLGAVLIWVSCTYIRLFIDLSGSVYVVI